MMVAIACAGTPIRRVLGVWRVWRVWRVLSVVGVEGLANGKLGRP